MQCEMCSAGCSSGTRESPRDRRSLTSSDHASASVFVNITRVQRRRAALSLAVHLATKLFAMRKPGRKSRRRDPNAFGAVCNNSGVERVALLALRCLLALTRASCSAEAEPPPRPGARLRAADSTRARRAAVGSSGAGARRRHRRPQEFAA